MDIVTLLSSLNKIGLVAFLITLGFLIYEIVLLSSTKKTGDAPQVPQFQEGAQPLPPTLEIKESHWKNLTKNLTENNKIVLIVLSILLIFFGILTLLGYINSSSKPVRVSSIVPTSIQVRRSIPTVNIPTKALISSPTPAEILLLDPTEAVLTTPSEIPLLETISPTIGETEESPTPSETTTAIEKLPVTSYINNSLILFSVATLFLFFSLLF